MGAILTMSNKVLGIIMMMTLFIYVSWPNYVPAVAVTRKRLVLLIFNRFKGYLDCQSSPQKGTNWLEFNIRRHESTENVERWNSVILYMALVKAKASYYVITDVEGRRLCIAKRIRYPSSLSRKWWMS